MKKTSWVVFRDDSFHSAVNLLTVGFGVLEGWTSPSIALLTSNETPLASGKITMDEASWVASLLHVGALLGNIFFGYVTNNFGRKLPLMCIAIPMIVISLVYKVFHIILITSFLFSRYVGCSFGLEKMCTIYTRRDFWVDSSVEVVIWLCRFFSGKISFTSPC